MDPDPTLISEILDDLGSNDAKRMQRGCKGVVAIGEPAVPPLLDALATGLPFLKNGVLLALTVLGPAARSAVPHLVRIVREREPTSHPHPEIGQAGRAAQALGAIGDPAVVPSLIEALRDSNYLCTCAAGALGKIGDTRAIEPLIHVLRDPDKFWVPRRGAAMALGDFGGAARVALPALEEALTYDCVNSGEKWDERARVEVEDAIDRITGRSTESKLKGHRFWSEVWMSRSLYDD